MTKSDAFSVSSCNMFDIALSVAQLTVCGYMIIERSRGASLQRFESILYL